MARAWFSTWRHSRVPVSRDHDRNGPTGTRIRDEVEPDGGAGERDRDRDDAVEFAEQPLAGGGPGWGSAAMAPGIDADANQAERVGEHRGVDGSEAAADRATRSLRLRREEEVGREAGGARGRVPGHQRRAPYWSHQCVC